MNRHSMRRTAAAVVLAGGIAAGTLAGAMGASATTSADYGYGQSVEGRVVSPQPLNVRYGPGTGHWITGTVNNGMHVWITCKTEGTNVGGNDRWYQLADDQGWVSAYYVNNYDYVPWCNS
ncbi:SH3 domain-containing protein [Streptomyces humicola]|nr:SH3 domain-containing protein [Streptomyces humicola]